MANTAATESTYDGYAKEIYGQLEGALPRSALLQQKIPFKEMDRLGDSYHFPVLLSREHGFTFAGGSNAKAAFTLNNPEVAVSKDATLSGTCMMGRTAIAYSAISRLGGGKASFQTASEASVMGLKEAAHFYLELMMLYGNRAIAKIASGGVSGTGTSRTLTIDRDYWSPGMWAQLVNGYVDNYDTEALGTKANASTIQVTAVNVDPATRTVTVTGSSTDMSAITASTFLCPRGWKSDTFDGINNIFTNTGSLFGIDAATYPLWLTTGKGFGSAAATMGKVQGALAVPVGQGLTEDIEYLCNVFTWADLNANEAALRRFAEDTKTKVSVGTQAIEYWGPNGAARIQSHQLVQTSKMFGLVPKHWKRVGSSDITYNLQKHIGMDRFVLELANAAGVEFRIWMDQALICSRPAQQSYANSIVNSQLQS